LGRRASGCPSKATLKVKSAPVKVFTPSRGNSSISISWNLNIMKLHHPSKRCQLPDLIDRPTHQDFCTADYRLRLIASRFRVSLSTAETIITNAGFSNGERGK
jgi:hypothetical protein